MTDLQTDVQFIKGVGVQRKKLLDKLGIHTLFDLISHFPRDYDDRTQILPIAEAPLDRPVCILAMVVEPPRLSRVRRGMELVKLRAVDSSGSVDITYFNQSYLREQFYPGTSYYFYGRLTGSPHQKAMVNPVFEQEGAPGLVTRRIVPVYPSTAGLSQRRLVGIIAQGLAVCGDHVPDFLPAEIQEEYRLIPAATAYRDIHWPPDFTALTRARRRLIFEEFFVLGCAMERLHIRRSVRRGLTLAKYDPDEFYRSLPFSPTNAQLHAAATALTDMQSGRQMNRLIQGDVGSGKTLVAAVCIWAAWKSGLQSAFMAPTELLVQQHSQTLGGFLAPLGLRVEKLVGAMTAKQKRKLCASLAAGEIDLVVGTHALLSNDVDFSRLGLVITDEQHRFGVEQRTTLSAKGHSPHVMVMSATPIPRTLALIIYGDLDVSVLDELPPGRKKVDTFVVGEAMRPRLYSFIRRLTAQGRQVYVVCPQVEEAGPEKSNLPMRSAVEHAGVLQDFFPDLHVACIHGRMKPKEKEASMAAFAAGETQILVATTVIEVGVDVPNAALMIVENAERFGLSQLHQLRGRVGRGEHRSYCVLVSDSGSEGAKARLHILCQTNDGFRISEEDLRLRGPGDFFGQRQHGLPTMHIADLCGDIDLLQEAQGAAVELLKQDPTLSAPEHRALRDHVEVFFQSTAPKN